MKHLIMFLMVLTMTLHVSANDTIRVDNSKIERLVEDETINTKGKKTIKYYIIYDGELVNTNKTVHDKIKLCRKYNVKCALVLVKTKSSKRIILD